MKQKTIFAILSLLMLSLSSFAQAPVKGDVNEDGKVDEDDISAIIEIIKNGQNQPTYYWYVGQIQPTSMTSNPIVDDSNFTNNKWHTLNANQINQTVNGGTAGNPWYVAVPTDKEFKAYASDLVTPNTAWDKLNTPIIVNSISYDVWQPASTGAKMNIYMK